MSNHEGGEVADAAYSLGLRRIYGLGEDSSAADVEALASELWGTRRQVEAAELMLGRRITMSEVGIDPDLSALFLTHDPEEAIGSLILLRELQRPVQ